MTESLVTPPNGDSEMPPGQRVRIDGSVRTIPAAQVPRFDAIRTQVEGWSDDPEVRRAAIRAAALYLLDDLGAFDAGIALSRARTDMAKAAAASRVVAILSIEDGASELATAQHLGVDRLTVRKWNGKQDR